MSSIFNFQHGDFYNSTPDCLTILSLIFTIAGALANIAAIIAAFIIYNKQRNDSAKDAFESYQDSLAILNEAVDKTIELLTDFKKGLANPNDDFVTPSLPVNLNDKFLSRIDFSSLTRHYKKGLIGKLEKYRTFLKQLSYVGTYHTFFLNELNYFRDEFKRKEKEFQKHNILTSKFLPELAGHNYEHYDVNFGADFTLLLKNILSNKDIVKDGLVINRNRLSEEYVKQIALISSKYTFLDAKAIEVNRLSNEIYAARYDINNLKNNMAANIAGAIKTFENIKTTIQELIEFN